MTEIETARALYDRVRRDSGGRMAPYEVVWFVAGMMHRDPMAVLNAIGPVRVAEDDDAQRVQDRG